MSNEFTELYKTYSTKQLVDVISRKDDYQAEAVIAAQNELDSRNISAIEIDQLKTEILNTPPTISKAEKLTNDAANYTTKKVTDFIFVKGPQTADSLLNRFTIVLLILGALRLYNGWWMIRLIIEVPEARGFDLSIFLYFLDYFILPICAFLIWARHRWAWFFIIIYSVFNVALFIASLYEVLTWNPSGMGIPDFNRIFPKPHIAPIIVWLLFWSGTIYLFCRNDVKSVFKITRSEILYTIGITVCISLLYFFA